MPDATERNRLMLTAIEQQNENKRPVPMAPEAIDRLRMQRERGSRKATVPLPPSLKALLAYDSKLQIRGRAMFECLDKTLLKSTTMTDVFRASRIAPAYKDLKKSAEADMPALIELPLGSDQRVFVYVATPDADGEYPILRWDDEPCIWISSGCLQDEVCGLSDAGATKRKERAEKAVAKWLKREPEQRFYEDDDDDDD
jgi:hypothetical protein